MERTREQFLADRMTGIGGSDVAAILGLSKWRTPYQVWEEKTGRKKAEESKELFHFGNVLEQVVADEFAARRGVKIQKRNQMFRSEKHPELVANIDRYIVGGGVLECKTADKFTRHLWGDSSSDEVPEYYLTQVQHYMHVTGWHEGYLAVLIGGNEYRDYEIPYDVELAEYCAERCVEFWNNYVVKDVPPPLTAADDLSNAFNWVSGSTITATPEIETLIEKIKELKSAKKEAETLEAELSAQVKIFIGENETLFSRDGVKLATWKQNKNSQKTVIDWESIVEEAGVPAEIITKHTRIDVKPGNRPFLVK